jgi:trans-2,3-dihydro-3-hydroxyanthranilate isomerase
MHQYVMVDVFTDVPLEGNPAAILTDARGIPAERMQRIAREFNLSETVFVLPAENGGDARVRIFTPSAELPFAGHPVLGTAFVLGQASGIQMIRLETGVGVVPVELARENGRIASGRMRQPVPTWEPYEQAGQLLAALGAESSALPESGLPVEEYRNGPRHVYVELGEQAVASLRPDLGALAKLPGIGVCCFAGAGSCWKSRYFAPGLGVSEDPATGSAAGPLAVHLARHGRTGFGQEIEIRQGAEIGRPSRLYARANGTAGRIDSVEVAGAAVVIARGELDA